MEPFYLFMAGLLAISAAHSLCALTCLVRIFVKGEVGVGCACFIPVVGPLLLLFYSWSKAEEWEQQRLMLAFTAAVLLHLLFGGVMLILLIKAGITAGHG